MAHIPEYRYSRVRVTNYMLGISRLEPVNVLGPLRLTLVPVRQLFHAGLAAKSCLDWGPPTRDSGTK